MEIKNAELKKVIIESISKRGLVSNEENVEKMREVLKTKSLGELAIMQGIFKSNHYATEYSKPKKRKKPNKDKIDELFKKADKIFKEIEEIDKKLAKHYFYSLDQLQKLEAQTITFNYINLSQKLMKLFADFAFKFDDIYCSVDELFLNLEAQGLLGNRTS